MLHYVLITIDEDDYMKDELIQGLHAGFYGLTQITGEGLEIPGKIAWFNDKITGEKLWRLIIMCQTSHYGNYGIFVDGEDFTNVLAVA